MYPFIHLTDNFLVPTYMLVLSLTYCFGLIFTFWRCKQQDRDLHLALDLALAIMAGGFIGARLFHVIYENPEIYRAHPSEILRFWQGGFVYYGGLIGAIFLAWLYTQIRRISFLEWADFFAPILSFGYAIGRIACLLNGCCYGRYCDLPWAIEFHYPGLPLGLRHPAPLYASLFELGVFLALLAIEKNRRNARLRQMQTGDLFLIWIMLHGCGRIVMETFRDDFRGPSLAGFSVSSVISFVLVISGLVIIRIRHHKRK